MARKGVRVLSFIILTMVVCVSSDFAQDKAQCQNQLLGLSSCLEYVSGDVKTPTPSCCAELGKDLVNNTVCLCILVRDRNEPNLGFKLNATLALLLPSVCQLKTKAPACRDLLHLAPNSPEAQVFKQFGSSPSAGADTNTSSSSESSSSKLSVFGRATLGSVAGVFLRLFLSVFVMSN